MLISKRRACRLGNAKRSGIFRSRMLCSSLLSWAPSMIKEALVAALLPLLHFGFGPCCVVFAAMNGLGLWRWAARCPGRKPETQWVIAACMLCAWCGVLSMGLGVGRTLHACPSAGNPEAHSRFFRTAPEAASCIYSSLYLAVSSAIMPAMHRAVQLRGAFIPPPPSHGILFDGHPS